MTLQQGTDRPPAFRLKALEVIDRSDRISSVDVFRCLAILAVVAFHFNERVPYGYIGVDLFFVVSGLLVGRLLTTKFKAGDKVSFFQFVLERGFKIWPSYYAFLILGTLLAIAFYQNTHPEQIIRWWDAKRYIFFYQNYTGLPFHWSFDHVWSLCVEEHFYILLPVLFLFIQRFVGDRHRVRALFTFVILTIVAGIVFKHFSYYLTNSKDTYSATHNRIDALAWGVLLNLIILYHEGRTRSRTFATITTLSGLVIFAGTLYFMVNYDNVLFEKVYQHSILPVSFFLMLAGLYHVNFSRLKPFRFVAYYSYNWYLWHPVFAIFLTDQLGNTTTGFLVYLGVTFLVAMAATALIEEPALKRRKAIVTSIFRKGTVKG